MWVEERTPTLKTLFHITQAGAEEYGQAGERWMPQLQVSHLIAGLRRINYDDNHRARLRRHLLLYAPKGLFKTSVCNAFLKDYAGVRNLVDVDYMNDKSTATEIDLGGRGISFERMRGSASPNGDIIEPLLPFSTYYKAGELMSFLGHQQAQRAERMDLLNEILEEGRVTVALIKMRNGTPKNIGNLAQHGIVFNAAGIMSYKASGTFIGCSRPFDEKLREQFEDSGFLSRLRVLPWFPAEAAVKEMWRRGPSPTPSSYLPVVREFNRKLWDTHFANVPFPPAEQLSRVVEAQDRLYTKIEAETNIPVLQLRGFRDRLDTAHLLTAMAVGRTVETRDYENDGYVGVNLDYHDIDADRAISFIEEHAMVQYDEALAKYQMDPQRKDDMGLLSSYLEGLDDPTQFEARDFVKWAVAKGVGQSTVYKKLKKMVQHGWLNLVTVGVFAPTKDVLDQVRPEFALAEETPLEEEA